MLAEVLARRLQRFQIGCAQSGRLKSEVAILVRPGEIEAVEEYLSPGTLRERERSNADKAKTGVRPSRPWWVNLGRSM